MSSARAPTESHGHGSCPCGHDHHAHHQRGGHSRGHAASGLWATVVPVLECAVCPACVSTYAKVFATLGVAAALSEREHLALLVFAVVTSVGVSAHRSWRLRRAWPVIVAVTGCTLLSAGHLVEANVLEWLGMAILVIGGILERRAARRIARGAEAGLAAA